MLSERETIYVFETLVESRPDARSHGSSAAKKPAAGELRVDAVAPKKEIVGQEMLYVAGFAGEMKE